MRLTRAAAVVFRLHEIGKHTLPVPAGISELRPMIVVVALAANENQSVDRTRSAKPSSARPIDLSIMHVGLRVGVKPPIVGLMKHRFSISDRDMDPEVIVLGTSLDQQTLCRPSALSRLASTHPDDPAPTIT